MGFKKKRIVLLSRVGFFFGNSLPRIDERKLKGVRARLSQTVYMQEIA
jgi:hypothetical protein